MQKLVETALAVCLMAVVSVLLFADAHDQLATWRARRTMGLEAGQQRRTAIIEKAIACCCCGLAVFTVVCLIMGW